MKRSNLDLFASIATLVAMISSCTTPPTPAPITPTSTVPPQLPKASLAPASATPLPTSTLFLPTPTLLANLKVTPEPAVCFSVDGQPNDWQRLKPLIQDALLPTLARTADVREVYAATCKSALYVMIVVDAPANAGPVANFAFEVDLNGDETPEYQPGFDSTRVWLWNLKGTGYADQKNLSFLSDPRVAIGQVAEVMIPLNLLDSATSPGIRVYTFVGSQMANRRTVWGKVMPAEGQ